MPAAPSVHRPNPVLAAFAGFAATTVVWFDFLIYGTAAVLVLGRLFFSAEAPSTVAMATIATFAVTLVGRPLGAIVFGIAGDLGGRRLMLTTALVVMGLATTLIGVLPGYETLGLAATAMLVGLRFVQGIALGGMWAGAATLSLEHAPPRRRAFTASWTQAGLPAGSVLASTTFLLVQNMPQEQFTSWGWRLPFVGSAVLTMIVFVVLLLVGEPPATQAARRNRPAGRRSPLLEVLVRYIPRVLVGAFAVAAGNALFFVGTSQIAVRAFSVQGSAHAGLTATLIASALTVVTIPLVGLLADVIGHRLMMQIGAGITALAAVPILLLADLASTAALLTAAVVALPIGYAFAAAAVASYLPGLFETGVRATGAGLAFQLGSWIGLVLPFLASFLNSWTGSGIALGALIAVVALISLGAVSLLPRSPMEMEARSR